MESRHQLEILIVEYTDYISSVLHTSFHIDDASEFRLLVSRYYVLRICTRNRGLTVTCPCCCLLQMWTALEESSSGCEQTIGKLINCHAYNFHTQPNERGYEQKKQAYCLLEFLKYSLKIV